jgi:hypothetical protein
MLAGVVAALGVSVVEAVSQEPAATEPLYPQLILPADDSFSDDAELTRFRQAVVAAREKRITDANGNQVYDPDAMLPFLGETVEVLIAPRTGILNDAFRSLGRHDARVALEIAGRLSNKDIGIDPVVGQRYGMMALGSLVAEGTVGPSKPLAGRICNANFGEISWPDWLRLTAKLPLRIDEWVVAVSVEREHAEEGELVPADWPKRFQLVPVSPEQKASAGSIGILTPAGGKVFFRDFFGESQAYFAPYRNDHVCFERGDDGWKITAIAMRLE